MKINRASFLENDTQRTLCFQQKVQGVEVDIYRLICGILFYN